MVKKCQKADLLAHISLKLGQTVNKLLKSHFIGQNFAKLGLNTSNVFKKILKSHFIDSLKAELGEKLFKIVSLFHKICFRNSL